MSLLPRPTHRLATLLYGVLDPLCAIGDGGAPSASPDRPTVLVVRLDAIGDFLLWTGSARSLATLYPPAAYRLVLVANRAWAELARSLGVFEEILELDRVRFLRSPRYRLGLLRAIRRRRARTCLQPTFSREFLFGDAVVRASGARERIGLEGDLSNQRRSLMRLSDRWYTRRIEVAPGPRMELERNAEFLRGLGMASAAAAMPHLEPRGGPPAGFDAAPYYVLFPGASSPLKRWGIDCFAELAQRLHERTGLKGVVCGGPDEETLGRELAQRAAVPLESWAGRTTLLEFCAILRGARIVVTNDTAAVHGAVAVGTPVVCVEGGGQFGRFVPYAAAEGAAAPSVVFHRMDCYGCNWRCIYDVAPGAPAPCVARIAVGEVWERVEELLARDRA